MGCFCPGPAPGRTSTHTLFIHVCKMAALCGLVTLLELGPEEPSRDGEARRGQRRDLRLFRFQEVSV